MRHFDRPWQASPRRARRGGRVGVSEFGWAAGGSPGPRRNPCNGGAFLVLAASRLPHRCGVAGCVAQEATLSARATPPARDKKSALETPAPLFCIMKRHWISRPGEDLFAYGRGAIAQLGERIVRNDGIIKRTIQLRLTHHTQLRQGASLLEMVVFARL